MWLKHSADWMDGFVFVYTVCVCVSEWLVVVVAYFHIFRNKDQDFNCYPSYEKHQKGHLMQKYIKHAMLL